MPNINDAIVNEEIEDEVQATEQGVVNEPAEATEPVERKAISLDDALAKAFEKHTSTDEKPKTALPTTAEAPAATPGKVVDPITGREQEPMKAPAGWTPTLREKWSGIDPTVQKFIHDRELSMAQTISKTADERKLATEFKEIAAPYEAMLRGFNTTATAHAKELFNLSHTLNTGTPQVKAQVMFNLINHFRPDPQTLQALFAGQQPQQQAPQVDVEKLVEQKLAAREEAQQQATIASDIAKFEADPKNEFYNEVKGQMSRILSAELVDAPTLPEMLKKAYDLACSQHPDVSQALAMRNQTTPAAPNAARPKPVGAVKPSMGTGKASPVAPKKMSLDDAIAEAMRRHTT